MINFQFQNPTKLIFGKGSIAKIAEQFTTRTKIMLTFGGGSVKRNGVYEQVIAALKDHDVVEFWGIEPNPHVETLRKAIELGKKEKVEFIIAVGGGSTVDGSKLIAASIPHDFDAWDLLTGKAKVDGAIPLGAVMTMPATGSEMNKGAVITCEATKEKLSFYSYYPRFAILDPEVTYSIPEYQVACGIADTFVHVMEQYLTAPDINPVMDRWAEGILQTLIEIAPQIKEEPKNYDLMAQYMLCATLGLNGYIALGVPQDWATHMIGHELTALHGITHGETLAIVLPATMTVMCEQKRAKILQYGERVWGITKGDETQRVLEAIGQTERFFAQLGLKTRLNQFNIGEETLDEIERRFTERNVHFGELGNITAPIARAILECAM